MYFFEFRVKVEDVVNNPSLKREASLLDGEWAILQFPNSPTAASFSGEVLHGLQRLLRILPYVPAAPRGTIAKL